MAKLELEDAVKFYEFQYKGFGQDFKNEIKKSVKRIARFPRSWPKIHKEIRKYLLHKFPCKLLYSIEKVHILIIAVAYQHRKPDYWIEISE